MSFYLRIPHYATMLATVGYGPKDFADGGSDRLIETLIGIGTAEHAAARVRAHLDAGADQVAIQVLGAAPEELGGQLAQLAEHLLG